MRPLFAAVWVFSVLLISSYQAKADGRQSSNESASNGSSIENGIGNVTTANGSIGIEQKEIREMVMIEEKGLQFLMMKPNTPRIPKTRQTPKPTKHTTKRAPKTKRTTKRRTTKRGRTTKRRTTPNRRLKTTKRVRITSPRRSTKRVRTGARTHRTTRKRRTTARRTGARTRHTRQPDGRGYVGARGEQDTYQQDYGDEYVDASTGRRRAGFFPFVKNSVAGLAGLLGGKKTQQQADEYYDDQGEPVRSFPGGAAPPGYVAVHPPQRPGAGLMGIGDTGGSMVIAAGVLVVFAVLGVIVCKQRRRSQGHAPPRWESEAESSTSATDVRPAKKKKKWKLPKLKKKKKTKKQARAVSVATETTAATTVATTTQTAPKKKESKKKKKDVSEATATATVAASTTEEDKKDKKKSKKPRGRR